MRTWPGQPMHLLGMSMPTGSRFVIQSVAKNLGNNTLDVPEILRYVLDDFAVFLMKMYPPIVKGKIYRAIFLQKLRKMDTFVK